MVGKTISLFGFLNDLLELVLLHVVNTMSQGTLNRQISNQNWDPSFGSMICLMNLPHEMKVFMQRQVLH
jgi:hypothetical protein